MKIYGGVVIEVMLTLKIIQSLKSLENSKYQIDAGYIFHQLLINMVNLY